MNFKFITIFQKKIRPQTIHTMQKIIFFIGILLCFQASISMVQAQDPASVNVNELTDQQIQQIVTEVNARGLTLDQAAAMAQMQGASATQIEQVKRRIQELQFSEGKSIANPAAKSVQTSTFSREEFSEKAVIKATPKIKRIFGFQLFNSENLTFEPALNIPTPQTYVLGIDDELFITIWGASQQTYQLRIEANGAVQIPDVGPVYVSGIEFQKAKELIGKRLIAIYQGMGGNNPNTWAEVSISNLRSIKIDVIGEINAPGTYTLPSTASAFNALYLSGGPNENGSFREIRLIRDGVTFKTIDVYDFLINADPTTNVQLREQDIIFVPNYKTRVEIAGEIKRPGIFEIKTTETMSDLIRFAGGFGDKAYTQSLTVIRNNDREREIRTVVDTDFSKFALQNGDSVRADSSLNRFSNRVAIKGAVFHPGNYELTPGMKLSDLIKKADGLREDAFMNRGLVSRIKEDNSPENISFDLKEIMKGSNDILLRREDKVLISSIFQMRERRTVNLSVSYTHLTLPTKRI